MNFRKGDRVKFLNDVGQGVIARFQDKNIAIVLNDDGFEIPVLMSELLKTDDNYTFHENTDDETFQSDKTETDTNNTFKAPHDNLDVDGLIQDDRAAVYFALVPTNQKDTINSGLDTYLINDSNFRILYTISKKEEELQSLLAYGNLEKNTKIALNTIQRDDLSAYDEINFQLLFFAKGNYYLMKPVNKTWNVKPSRFYKQNSCVENDFFHEKAFLFEITKNEINMADFISDDDIEAAKKEKEKLMKPKQFKSIKKGPEEEIEEIDLHIQELIDDHSNLSNSEILEIQMSRFITALDGGIIAGTKKMVFIHGVGNGRLKSKVNKTLERKYPKLRYQDASFKEYGYGATMVMIK